MADGSPGPDAAPRQPEQGPAVAKAPKPKAFEVIRVEDQHVPALTEFYRKVWDPKATVERLSEARVRYGALNPVDPDTPPPVYGVLVEGEMVGHLGTVPARFFSAGKESYAYWLKGLWVLPEHRSGPVGFAVLRAATSDLDAVAGVAAAIEARRLFDALGVTDRGALSDFILPLDPFSLFRKFDPDRAGMAGGGRLVATFRRIRRWHLGGLAGLVAGVGLRILQLLRGRPPQHLRVERGWEALTRAHLDALWAEVSPQLAAAAVRDGEMIAHRFQSRGSSYTPVSAWDGDRLRAWVMVRSPKETPDQRLSGLRVATLSDALFSPAEPSAALAALAGAERLARDIGADALLGAGSHPVLQDALRRRGYLPLSGSLHLLARTGKTLPEAPADIGAWWCTRSDGDADEVF